MASADQYCDYCGEYVGTFSHCRRLHGPVTCGNCESDARADEMAERDERRSRAEEDEYGRY